MSSFQDVCNSALVAVVTLYLLFLNLRSGVNILCSSNEDGKFIISRIVSDVEESCYKNKFLSYGDTNTREKKNPLRRLFGMNKNKRGMNAHSIDSNIESVQYENTYTPDTENIFCYGAVYTLIRAGDVLPFIPPVPLISENTCPENFLDSQLEYKHESISFRSKHFIRKKMNRVGNFLQRRRGKKTSSVQPNKQGTSVDFPNLAPDWLKESYGNPNPSFSTTKKQQIEDLDQRLKERLDKEEENGINVPSFVERVEGIHWGGYGPNFWSQHSQKANNDYSIDGAHLLASYLKIMEWPKDLRTKFPFKLCHAGCDSDFAIAHTIEWREKYKPWLMTPSALIENDKGWIYHRGYSKNPFVNDNRKGGYSMIWYRPGLKKIDDGEAYIRTLLNAFDLAIADAFMRSNQKIGKVNVVLDCTGFRFSYIPTISQVIKLLKMLQDHYPDKLGMLIITNLQGAAGIVLKMVMPLLPPVVQDKIKVLPNDEEECLYILRNMVDENYLPDWLGGSDSFQFEKESYYNKDGLKRLYWSDEEGREYLTTMPYHA